jgi:hypothetical protein
MKVHIGKYPKNHKKERKISIKIDRWDSYSAYHTMALIIHPLLIEYKSKMSSYPASLSAKKWEKIIDKMIFSFENIVGEDFEYVEVDGKYSHEETMKQIKKVQDGLNLFGKYFQQLWW